MTMTYAQAIDAINAGPKTTAQLLDIFKQLSGQAAGATLRAPYDTPNAARSGLAKQQETSSKIAGTGAGSDHFTERCAIPGPVRRSSRKRLPVWLFRRCLSGTR
jgi:hypothetical protein